MHPALIRHLLIVLGVAWSVAVAPSAAAQEPPDPPAPSHDDVGPPPRAEDGIPVSGWSPSAPSASIETTEAETAELEAVAAEAQTTSTAPHRYFGSEPYQAIVDAVAGTTRCSDLPQEVLRWMVLAPVFGESSGATTPESAPAPMTLSRFDEWSGVVGTDSNANANHGLYAGRNPATPYKRAFWHPGIGIWQYDSAGVGAPYTAAQRMDTLVVATDVAAGMATRFCTSSGDGLQRRQEAWRPWWAGDGSCAECEVVLQQLKHEPEKFHPDVPMSRSGGLQARTCSINGGVATFTCWYVDPAVAQGATWWATLTPLDGGDPTNPPTPISKPFYVFARDGDEERHWLRADTGYNVDIRASRRLGFNARPRSTQPGSGLDWQFSSALCDHTTLRGACFPVPPAPKHAVEQQVYGTYLPVDGDLDGDGFGDILWYGPGSDPDAAWFGRADGGFDRVALEVRGTYDPLVGDFDGDGRDDIFWYAAGSPVDSIWYGASPYSARAQIVKPVSGDYRPLLADFNGDERTDIYWYAPGSAPDSVWLGREDRSFAHVSHPVQGTYEPLLGDFDNDGGDDVFWYAPGDPPDSLWLGQADGSFERLVKPVKRVLLPRVGDFDGDGWDDIFWHAAGPELDSIWYGAPGANFHGRSLSVLGTYRPVVADLDGDGVDDVLWYAPGPGSDSVWFGQATREFDGGHVASIMATYEPIVGQYDDGAGEDVMWYAAGTQVGESRWLDP